MTPHPTPTAVRSVSRVALTRAAAIWTGIGLLGGLLYRELTRGQDLTGATSLSLVHTHALALGAGAMLGVLVLTVVLSLDRDRRLRWFTVVWNSGLTLTVGALATRGLLEVSGSYEAGTGAAKAIAGVAGLGHIMLTVAFVLLFIVLFKALSGTATPQVDATAASRQPVATS